MNRKVCVFLILVFVSFGCGEVDYYEMGYNDGYNDALLGGQRYSPPAYGVDDITDYRRGYFQGYSDGVLKIIRD